MDRILAFFTENSIPCKGNKLFGTAQANSTGVICQCIPNNLKSFPTFDFLVGDYDFVLEPNAYMTVNDPKLPTDKMQECHLNIVYHSSLSRWVLGAPFMRQYLMSFDIASQKVGLLCGNPLTEGEKKKGTFCTANPVEV